MRSFGKRLGGALLSLRSFPLLVPARGRGPLDCLFVFCLSLRSGAGAIFTASYLLAAVAPANDAAARLTSLNMHLLSYEAEGRWGRKAAFARLERSDQGAARGAAQGAQSAQSADGRSAGRRRSGLEGVSVRAVAQLASHVSSVALSATGGLSGSVRLRASGCETLLLEAEAAETDCVFAVAFLRAGWGPEARAVREGRALPRAIIAINRCDAPLQAKTAL